MTQKRFTAEQIITGSAPVARSSLMAVSASGARLSAQAKTPRPRPPRCGADRR